MKVSDFTAAADIVGRRIRVSWQVMPEGSETLADIAPVTLRRKVRDFAFPAPLAKDPFLVYDSNAFPPNPIPDVLTVTDLPTWEVTEDGERTVFAPISVARSSGGRMIEILRRTISTTYNIEGVPVRQRVEILDLGQKPGNLEANTVYYYQLFGNDLPTQGSDAALYRTSVMVTDTYGLNRTLYESLPEIYRRHDVETRPITPGTESVPEQSPRSGQLRRFVDLFGISLDSLRGTAEGLRTLHDVDHTDARYLSLLSQWIGWDLSIDGGIPLGRNEIKAATRLYRLVGTLPGMRALVSQYTGWFTQVAEFAQNLALSNRPPRRNLFAITAGADGVTWHGADDAAELLGFATSNQESIGSAGTAASLTGTIAEPFALRSGMELILAVDGLLPSTARFGRDDFAEIGRATAAEVAAAIRRAIPEATATASGGVITLTSKTFGDQSALKITTAATSLVSLESSPSGHLSSLTDSQSRTRLFYEAWETPTQPEADALTSGVSAISDAGNYLLRRVRYKTFLDGTWRNSHPMFEQRAVPQADPAAISLPDDRVWAAWIENPQTDAARLRFAIGSSRPMMPARLLGQRSEPFALADGAVLTLAGNWPGVDTYTVRQADFADIAHARAVEVVAAMKSQLTQVTPSRERNGSIRIETIKAGPQARLAVDLRQSNTARALGFDERNATGTPGSWSEEIDWSSPLNAVTVNSGRHAEVAAVSEAGGVRLAWATHLARQWRIYTAHWDERTLIGTANGLFIQKGNGPWSALSGLPSKDVRAVAFDSDGTGWIATASGAALLSPTGIITPLAPPLAAGGARNVALGFDGTAWFATASGVEGRAPDGSVITITAPNLPSNDTRAIAVTGHGALWIATAGGAAVRLPDGSIRIINTTNGLPSDSIRDVAVASDGTVYLATASGLAVGSPGGGFTIISDADGIGSADVRAVKLAQDGTVWVATARGVSRRLGNGKWTIFDTEDGLPSDNALTISLASDGAAWIGTSGGISIITPDGSVSRLDFGGGGADNPAVQSILAGWSAPREVASGGGANREPSLVTDSANRVWLIWSQRIGAGNEDESWVLRSRIFDPITKTWGPEAALTVPPAGGRCSDRTPSAQKLPGGIRVFFSSDRSGGSGLWSVDITSGGVVGPLSSLLKEAASDLSPTPVTIGGAVWLLYRSDRNVSLGQVGTLPAEGGPSHSVRVPDNGTVRRYAGTTSLTLDNLTRIRGRRLFGDMLSYTPNRPLNDAPLADDELYTRGTIGLYVSRASNGNPLTQQEAERLRELLSRFIPANLRALIVIVATANTEFVYRAGADLKDGYQDEYPFADAFGAVDDAVMVAMPGLVIIQSNSASNVSANPADLTTLRRRTFFPPLQ